ncbi:MAG: pitrilysin family protein [Nanoarchaeota archaeon]
MKQNFIRKKLKNGITVLFEKRELPLVSLSITNRFGAAFEESKIKGVAHCMEHLLFTGTKTRTHEDISREIEKKGGILNAFTSHEVTSFWFKLPSEHVFTGLEILTDMFNNVTFREDKFEKEKKIIVQEIRMYKDMPMRFVFDLVESCLYEKPFGESVIGSEETVMGLDRNFIINYFNKNYNPENYIVTIVGNADIDRICEYLEKNFKRNENKSSIKKINLKNGRKIIEKEGIDQAQFILGMHAPLAGSDEMIILEVLDAYLASGMSSRLPLKIREEKGLAYSVKGDISSEKNYSHYLIYVGTKKEVIDEVEKDIVAEFNGIDKMNENDLKEAKERLLGLKKLAMEESDGIMNQLMFSELAGKAEDFYEKDEKIKKVKLEDVKKLAKKLIKNYSIATILPK